MNPTIEIRGELESARKHLISAINTARHADDSVILNALRTTRDQLDTTIRHIHAQIADELTEEEIAEEKAIERYENDRQGWAA